VTYVDLDAAPNRGNALRSAVTSMCFGGNGNREFIATGGLLVEHPPQGCVFSDLLIKIPFDPGKTVEGFMPFLWQSQSFLRVLQSKAVSGSGLWKIWIALRFRPPMNSCFLRGQEQTDIVRVMRACDENIQGIECEARALGRLKNSLLQSLLTGRVRMRM